MTATFEERLAGELDDLWRGALFLTGGRGTEAEALLLRTIRGAFRRGPGRVDRFGRWVQARLSRTFLEGLPVGRDVGGRPPPPDPGFSGGGGSGGLDLAAICAGAAAVTPRARTALWLVLVQRWSYRDVAEALGWEEGEVRRALAERDRFVAVALGADVADEDVGRGGPMERDA